MQIKQQKWRSLKYIYNIPYRKKIFEFENLLFPPICYSCSKLLPPEQKHHLRYICPKCLSSLPFHASKRLSFPADFQAIDRSESLWHKRDDRIYAVFDFQDPISAMLARARFSSGRKYCRLLGSIAASWLRDLTPGNFKQPTAIIPLPLSKQEMKIRGFSQVELIASFMAEDLGLEILPAAARIKDNLKSRRLISQEEKKIYLNDAFILRPDFSPAPYRGHKLILLDDLLISATTLSACARPLLAAGLDLVYLVIAAARKQ